ncbi:MAG: ABC transporter permease [Nitrospira sp.]|jgi:spermidine/putrescine transport system permease protein|nr:ABC transporter permease [Nitrospira sp.]
MMSEPSAHRTGGEGEARGAAWWLLAPGLCWTALFCVLPMAVILLVSFATRGTYGGIVWDFSLENYRDLLHALYGRIFGQSLLLAALTTIICLAMGFPLAYYIARLAPRRQAVWLVLVMIPFWTNFLVRTYAWIFILRTEGLMNTVLLKFGLISTPLELLYTNMAVVLGLVYGYLPFMVLPLYAAIERVDRTLIEAAWDLYADRWSVFWRVLVPLTKPGIVAGCVLVFIPSLGAFITPDLLGGARSMMVGNLIQHEYLIARDWPLGSALSMVLMAFVTGAMIWSFRSRASANGKRRAS